jgi:DNA-binding response OmpR family regulator
MCQFWPRRVYLGHTKEFLLIESLNQRVGRFVPVNVLKDEVWDGGDPEPNTVQRTVSSLRKKLRDAGIVGPVIKPERGHYALMLP